jgi:ribulose-phosphate 3-epimerase
VSVPVRSGAAGERRRTRGLLAPSVLSADHARLAEQVALVEPHAGALHVDLMDGHFVTALAFAPAVVGALKAVTALPLRCHLVVEAPEQFIDTLADEGADLVIVHVERGEQAQCALASARERGIKTGLALKLDTRLSKIEAQLDELDCVLVMSIVPGWSGQPFRDQALQRIEQVREMIDRRGLDVEIEVDGGINEQTGRRCIAAGATVLAAATSVFQAADPSRAADRMAAIAAGE